MEFAANAAVNIWSIAYLLVSILIPVLFSLMLFRVIARAFQKTARVFRPR